MQIWIHLNGIQQGPYTLAQLQTMNLDPATPVWYDGLPKWMPAAEAPATAPLFAAADWGAPASPVAVNPQPQTQAEAPKRPSTYLVWNIIFVVLCCSPLAVAGIITGAISSSRYASGDYVGSERMSEVTAWLVILSIVWCLVSLPVGIAITLL